MFRNRLSLQNKILATILLTSFILLLSYFFWNIYQTKKSYIHLTNYEFQEASKIAQQSITLPKLLSTITFGQVPEIEIWHIYLETLPLIEKTVANFEQIGESIFASEPEKNVFADPQQDLILINEQLSKLDQELSKSLFFKKHALSDKIGHVKEKNSSLITLLGVCETNPQKVILMLQNTEELRATGGFMGSYVEFELSKKGITDLKINDIYEPDGQFAGYIEAPYGVEEYLSNGNGLRLPDSNWHPDFPTSAQQILSFMALGGEQNIDTIASINVSTVEKIINITGEIFLPDYGITVTADNLTQIARADRDEFFAGSKQKTQFLNSLFDQLKIKVSQLDNHQKVDILNTFANSLLSKDIQIFSQNEDLQKIVSKYKWGGNFPNTIDNQQLFALVESNVGINKANQKVFREVKVNLGRNRTDAEVTFNNQNTDLDYLNYQRIITKPDVSVTNLSFDHTPIELINQTLISDAQGNIYKETGFLLPIKSNNEHIFSFSLTDPNRCQINPCTILLFKQSGLPPTPYALTFEGETRNIILESDQVIEF